MSSGAIESGRPSVSSMTHAGHVCKGRGRKEERDGGIPGGFQSRLQRASKEACLGGLRASHPYLRQAGRQVGKVVMDLRA